MIWLAISSVVGFALGWAIVVITNHIERSADGSTTYKVMGMCNHCPHHYITHNNDGQCRYVADCGCPGYEGDQPIYSLEIRNGQVTKETWHNMEGGTDGLRS